MASTWIFSAVNGRIKDTTLKTINMLDLPNMYCF